MLTNTGGEMYIHIYIYIYKKTPVINRCHGNSSTSRAITQGHGCHCDVKLLQWACLRPTALGASAGSGSAGTLKKSALVHQPPQFDHEIKHCADHGSVELFWRSWPADGPPAGRTQTRPRTNLVIVDPQITVSSFPCVANLVLFHTCYASAVYWLLSPRQPAQPPPPPLWDS